MWASEFHNSHIRACVLSFESKTWPKRMFVPVSQVLIEMGQLVMAELRAPFIPARGASLDRGCFTPPPPKNASVCLKRL